MKKREAKHAMLYEIPQESKIMCETNDGSTFITFHHVDGMYSYCTTEKGGVIHLAATTPMKKLKKGVYEIDYEASR